MLIWDFGACNAGIISKNAFSLNFNWINGTSSILFGGYDNELIKNDKALSWVDLKSSSYWTVDIDNFKYDGIEISSSAYIKFYNSTSSNNTCAFLIDSYSGSSGGLVYLGYTFMREYYIYHDVTAQRVGLYRKGSSGHPSIILTIVTLVVLIVSF